MPRIDIEFYMKSIRPYLQYGLSLRAACEAAEIPYTTVLDYQKQDESVRYRINQWSNVLSMLSRKNLANDIKNGSISSSKWWLERKNRDEFSTSVNTDVTSNGQQIEVMSGSGVVNNLIMKLGDGNTDETISEMAKLAQERLDKIESEGNINT